MSLTRLKYNYSEFKIVLFLIFAIDLSEVEKESVAAADHRKLAIELFNHTWTLMDLESRTVEQTDEMLHSAHASTYHWLQVG